MDPEEIELTVSLDHVGTMSNNIRFKLLTEAFLKLTKDEQESWLSLVRNVTSTEESSHTANKSKNLENTQKEKSSEKQNDDMLKDANPGDKNGYSSQAHSSSGKAIDAREQERQLFYKVCKTFETYEDFQHKKVNRTLKVIHGLPQKHQELLKDYKEHLELTKVYYSKNQSMFSQILQFTKDMYDNQDELYGDAENYTPPNPTTTDYDKLNSILKQFVRDWSSEGKPERDACYGPILEEIEQQFSSIQDKRSVKILIPGSGTGRLPHEIYKRGFTSQGNEFSFYMLFASFYVLNKCPTKEAWTIYPWLSENLNVLHHKDQIRAATFPDIDPSDLPDNSGDAFSMVAGDFLEVYSTPFNEDIWDCIVTCFFIDCATNIVAFIERIYKCLKENGIWINFGPLLYHYADLLGEKSIEPSYDFVIEIAQKIGFKLEKEQLNVPTKFVSNEASMLSYSYKSVFFVCRKIKNNQVEKYLSTTVIPFKSSIS